MKGRSRGGIQYSYSDHPEHGQQLTIRIGVSEVGFARHCSYRPLRFFWGQWNCKDDPFWTLSDWEGWIGFDRYRVNVCFN